MSAPGDIEPGIADHDHRWLPAGRDGAWPERRIDDAQGAAPPANHSSIDQDYSRQPAVIGPCPRSGQGSRLSEMPGATAKSP